MFHSVAGRERMDKRLYEAALAGSATSLLELLREDALVLDKALVACVSDTPLHIAAILGHVDFAREILNQKREFAFELNSQGFTPLHLAAAKGYIEIVKELLQTDSSGDICLVRDGDGRTPLHSAAIKGRLTVMQKFLQAKPEAGLVKTDQGETILHLSVKHNHYELVRWVLEWADDDYEFVNMKNDDGNTALHISATKRQIQTVQLLLSKAGVEVNAVNNDGLTAIDVLLQRNPSELTVIDGIGKILEDAGTIRAKVPPTIQPSYSLSICEKNTDDHEKKSNNWVHKRWSALMVVAILIATVTFEGGLNAPGADYNYKYKHSFMVMDTTGFLVSLSIIILLISEPPLRPTVLMRLLMVLMWISVTFVSLTFAIFIAVVLPGTRIGTAPLLWLGLLYLWQFIRFVLWLLRACGILSRKKSSDVNRDVEMGIRHQF
ncbi:ankyrin repeat-containing protein BDA1-like protein [Cinnamomum micranthum f. kanehirae]|uniref:Ankyrin repeat-containing protein BDA1-like protein n=1 Tax=Cinnamomum micranthum f. kanehirae TaxID=337451 RepID=A0A3S3NLT3_9MAGN|nr:ankyrin repeat-containing protein BDA1-like protein [Cinnamomum micranthum f. kanehirae]